MIKVAIPHWQGRVSPVFDVAGRIRIVEIETGRLRIGEDLVCTGTNPQGRAASLSQAGVQVLICGAVSRQQELAIAAAGIEVIPRICGEIEQVLAAYRDGCLGQDGFMMPGCCGRRRRCRGRRGLGSI